MIPAVSGAMWYLRRALIVAAALVSGLAHAGPPTLTDLFRDPVLTSATLSPNGRYLAMTVAVPDAVQLRIRDLMTGTSTLLVSKTDSNIVGVGWLGNEFLRFRVARRQWRTPEIPGGVFTVRRTGGLAHPYQGRLISGLLAEDDSHVMTTYRDKSGDLELRKLDLASGRSSVVDYLSQRIAQQFVVDRHGAARVVATSNDADSVRTIWYRDAGGGEWMKLATFPRLDPAFQPLAVDSDDQRLLVRARNSKGLWGIFVYDVSKRTLGECIASDDAADTSDQLIYAPDSGKVLGVRLLSDPPRTIWWDPRLQAVQEDIDRLNPGWVNVVEPGNSSATWLVVSFASTRPTAYHLYGTQDRSLKQVANVRPWIDPSALSRTHVYDYLARDGLPIVSYLPLPQGRASNGLPLVVLVHDGPWEKDHWGFDPEVQFLSSLGYAVLQPQFRGSIGYGAEHMRKGFRQFGIAMQDDLTDGVETLVKQGLVDPRRVCIMGYGSYAGYAALMGVVRTPNQYRCAIDMFGISNLFEVSSSDPFSNRMHGYEADEVLGDPRKMREQFTLTSPNLQADRIQAPVFMVYGHHDTNHGSNMRTALERGGKTYEYVSLDYDEIGMRSEKTRYKVYDAMRLFLLQHNPP